MIEIIWAFVVKQDVKGQFELIFGPGGAWSKIYSPSPGFRGTTLLHDTNDPHRYLVVDIWDSIEQREEAISNHMVEYTDLQSTLDAWTDSKVELGIFRIQGKSTVRPYNKSGKNTSGATRKRSNRRTLR